MMNESQIESQIKEIEKEMKSISSFLGAVVLESYKNQVPVTVRETIESFLRHEIESRSASYREAISAKANLISNQVFESIEKSVEEEPEPVAEPVEPDYIEYHRNLTKSDPVKPGDIFYSSWGYDQTNIDFYKVISLTASGKSVKVAKIDTIRESDGQYMSEKVMPDPENIVGEIKTRRLKDAYFSLNTYSGAFRWDGRSKTATHYA